MPEVLEGRGSRRQRFSKAEVFEVQNLTKEECHVEPVETSLKRVFCHSELVSESHK